MKKGFSLMEMLMVITISVLVVGVLVNAYIAAMKIFNGEMDKSGAYLEASKAMDIMTTEIKNCLQVQTANSHTFTFWWKDLDSDGSMEAAETVSYSWDGNPGSSLTRTISGSSCAISKNVQNLSFTYDSATVSLIKNMTIDITNVVGSEIVTLESTINMRNL